MTHPLLDVKLFYPGGLQVKGLHSSTLAPVDRSLLKLFVEQHPKTLSTVLSSPAGFDGERAVLLGWRQDLDSSEQPTLTLETGFRTYSQGSALREVQKQTGALNEILQKSCIELIPGHSWGLSAVLFTLLPGGTVLAGLRGPTMLSRPNTWCVALTEIVEPDDIDSRDMSGLMSRLIQEEAPALERVIEAVRFNGLGVWRDTYCWSLISVLDLRNRIQSVDLPDFLSRLGTDDETSAWAAVPLDSSENVLFLETAKALAARC